MSFIETPRFPDDIGYSSVLTKAYQTNIIKSNSGREVASSVWSLPLHRYELAYTVKDIGDIETIINYFNACKGKFHQFRFKDHSDFRSCSISGTPGIDDQALSGTVDGVNTAFQLQKTYTTGSLSLARTITKPVAGTVLISIDSLQTNDFTVDTTTGIVTFNADKTDSITDITQATQATVTATNSLSAGNTVYITGVSGMTEINNTRAKVVSATGADFVIDLDTTGFTAYSTGGTYNTLPQTGEVVAGGFDFDVPVRFDQDELPISFNSADLLSISQLRIVEVRI